MGNSESTQSVNESEQTKTDDEPRWNEIEHENLLLEQLPAEVKTLPEEQKKATQTEETMEEFKNQLANKRLARQTALQEMREEINNLKAENRRLRQGAAKENEETPKEQSELVPVKEVDEDDENPSSRSRHANIELANAQLALQLANADNLSLRGELDVVQRQVGTLKEVICCCKQMLNVKEEQCAQLKMKLTEIENSFSEREMKIMSNNLRQEYERQLVNIRQLRQLYEERQRVAAAEYENLQRLISIKKDELIAEQEKTKSFEERNQLLNKELETANEELSKLREECSEHKYEKRILKEQVGAVNLLFSQLVMGFNGEHNMNIDRLTEMLEENRDLLNEMTQAEGSCSDGATLPKLLFELVEQAAKSEQTEDNKPTPLTGEDEDKTDSVKPESSGRKLHRRRSGGTGTGTGTGSDGAAASLKSHEPEIMGKVPATAQEIIGNLPKVWKVLMELLSHHKIERVQFEELPPVVASTTKTVEGGGGGATGVTGAAGALGATAKAPELSVSKTYIKLKDLIMEKKSLVKETNRLKTLNCHLDNRLNEQEKRLSAVSLELTKTWHLVGKMQRQHRQLHTQEQILRYQLQQKRRLLSELKDELEYCRRKWALARAKNDESQELCNDWRREFARRKLEDANHSAESGYSDSGPQSDEDSSGVGVGAGAGAGAVAIEATSSSHCRRKHLRDQFEHTRKIKRMQSTSPGRQAAAAGEDLEESEEIVLRWNSAPPTCGWRDEPDEPEEQLPDEDIATTSRGAVAKIQHTSRSRQRGQLEAASSSSSSPGAANERIQKLEEQCKSLIQQVLETSGNRERLEIQLCRFQDEISPAQHAVPLDEFINRKRLERMTRASSAPATGSLTPREEEYTRKRSERLGRLEEESRQLLSRIKRTADRGHYLKKSLDRIRRAPSREGSFESNTEEESKEETKEESKEEVKEESKEECMEETKREVKQESTEESKEESKAESKKESKAESKEETKDEVKQESKKETTESPVTIQEESYTSRRAARLQRLEQESQQLLKQLSRNSERGDTLVNRLDTLHEQSQRRETTPSVASISLTVEQRLEDIERVSANRAERLRRLEEQGNELIARLSNTSERGTAMINRIAEREANKRQEAEVLEQTEEATSSLDNNNIASSSFVPQELESQGAACCVTVTTTSTQLARKQSTGAIPKTSTKNKPLAQLCAAVRHEDAHKKRSTLEQEKVNKVASLEEDSLELMVQRLRAIPYPEEGEQQKEPKKEESRKEKELPKEEELKDEECNPEEIEDIELKDEETPKEEKPEKSEFKKGEREEKPKEEKSKKSDFKEEESEQNTPEEEEFPKEQLKEDNPQKEELKKEEPKKNKLKKEDDKESELKEEKSAEAKFEEQEPRKEESKEEQSTEQESKEEELTMKESLEDESKVNENKNSTSS